MALGFTINGKQLRLALHDEDNAREELVEFASFAGKSAQAFEFAKASALAGVNAGTEIPKADSLYDAMRKDGVHLVYDQTPVDNRLDFDAKVLILGDKKFSLEWLGRGGIVDLPRFAGNNRRGYSHGVKKQESPNKGENDYVEGDYINLYPTDSVANVLSSSVTDPDDLKKRHIPLIDIDFEAALIPSSQPGHYHLYLDKEMPHDQYTEFIEMLHKFGIVAEGNLNQVKRKGATFLRLPWVKKSFLG